MRLEPSIPAIPRTAVAPIDLHGTTIPRVDGVSVHRRACRDTSAWSEPDRFDRTLHRPDTPSC
jgi:cytochrome P450